VNQNSKQRIGLVLPNIPAYSETFFNSKIKGLQESGFEVVLFSKSKSNTKHPNCKTVFAPNFTVRPKLVIEVALIIWQCLIHFNKAFKLFQLNRKEGLSIKYAIKNSCINSYFFSYQLDWLHFGFGTMALKSEHVADAIHAKMAVSFRGFDFYVYPEKNPKCYDLLFSKKVKYHVLSSEMKLTLINYDILPEMICKITPAIDIDFFKSVTNFPDNSVIQFITVSRLHWIKGLEYSLEAFSLFKNQNIPFHYTIVGDGVEKEKLMFAVHQLGLTENVTFTGKIAHGQVKSYMEKSNYYIQYSIQEGFCNAVLEAQAMGLLCIVSDADGLRENVLNEKTGWVVSKRDPIRLNEKITEVVNLTEKSKQEIRKNGQERVKKEFNLDKQKQDFKTFYTD
jgi:colanic acid/amylovoran biosynthesis glycosyltransferase